MIDRRAVSMVLAVGAMFVTGCAGVSATIPPSGAPHHREALLVIPGFGYGRAGEKAIRSTRDSLAGQGIDLFVADYIRRAGLAQSRAALLAFYREQGLDRYEQVHIFAFIAGAWTVNPAIEAGELPNVASVIYDRSPYQERAPRIAMDRLRILARIANGDVLFDVARAPYAPIGQSGRRIGLLVETTPTGFLRRFAGTARRYGPYDFRCGALGQRHDDCAYLAMNHDELYKRFPEVVPDILHFIQKGRFTDGAIRTPPTDTTRLP